MFTYNVVCTAVYTVVFLVPRLSTQVVLICSFTSRAVGLHCQDGYVHSAAVFPATGIAINSNERCCMYVRRVDQAAEDCLPYP